MHSPTKVKCYNAWRRLLKRYGEALPPEWQIDLNSLINDIGIPKESNDFIWVHEKEGVIRKENVRWAKQSERVELNRLRLATDNFESVVVDYQGDPYTYQELADLFKLPIAVLHYRITTNWDEKDWGIPVDCLRLALRKG